MEFFNSTRPGKLGDQELSEVTLPEPKTSILLVDDQLSNLLALEAILAGLGQNLVRARSGTEALRSLLDEEFAVILMDVHMPIMDGFETAALIREREKTGTTPIIFLTAYECNDVQMFKGYSLGAIDYLNKPIVPEVLRSKVTGFVDLFQKTARVERQAELLRLNQQRDHERALAEERGRWEMERLREEAYRNKQIAQTLTHKAEELAQNISDRIKVEEQLRARARQQAIVADLGHRALSGLDLPTLLREAAGCAAETLKVDYGRLLEYSPEDRLLVCGAGFGWNDGATQTMTLSQDLAALPAYTLQVNEPVIIEDLASETRFSPASLLHEHGVASGISVIMHGQDRPIGVLEVFTRRPRSFTLDDVNFLQSIANVLAAAIQRKRSELELGALRDELAEQLADMTSLHVLSTRLSNTRDFPAVLAEVLDAVMGLQGTRLGVLMLNERDRAAPRMAVSPGLAAERLELITHIAAVLHERASSFPDRSECAVIQDLGEDPALARFTEDPRLGNCQTVCSIPLLTRSRNLLGTIVTLCRESRRPSERQIGLVELYIHQAAEYIENARLLREIQDADRHKDEFLAMLGHELRNPLAPMLTALHFMSLPSTDTDEAQQAQEIVGRQLRHLARLVDDLLDISRISSGKIQLRKCPVDLAAVVGGAVQIAQPVINANGHRLSVSLPAEPVILEADQARLEQVISNLLNNAAKYTEPGGRIELAAVKEGADVVLRVSDNGIGITPDLLPNVFDLFTQADRSLDRSQGGLGVGLTLVQRLVEMHGGSISASSAGAGHGSEFTICLPIGEPGSLPDRQQSSPAHTSVETGERRPRRVLVVEDNKDGAQILARLLRVWGHDVAVAHDGPAALESARAYHPEVVLLDIGLPGMNGYEVAQHLKEEDGMEKTFLVALTGYGQLEDQRESFAVGFDRHLVKPIDPAALKILLEERPPCTRPSPEAPAKRAGG
jgi:signal transduction histidine kinase/DNA-binding response OmpR family regulator